MGVVAPVLVGFSGQLSLVVVYCEQQSGVQSAVLAVLHRACRAGTLQHCPGRDVTECMQTNFSSCCAHWGGVGLLLCRLVQVWSLILVVPAAPQ